MVTQVTNGVKITVRTQFQAAHSRPDMKHFLFTYNIIIENKSEYTVQLLQRHWNIFDSNGDTKIVEGEGVVGQQPVIAPNDLYEYESACVLTTDMGKMHGNYQMIRIADKEKFIVEIPEFQLIAPARLN
ncbi:MAG TPA: Co2+/Mg2+ efflux protein ApaG [Bacteroidia bacterium]|jgi:ApaG protein|nr:Co2+/Mg2+ efflux protein ApaG [Bacteroidia bacterium]HNO71732.1 Co2+/Mg2+ efflux protein ApaG [Bacteroidia bacterium]